MLRIIASLLLILCTTSLAVAQTTPRLSPLTRKYLRERAEETSLEEKETRSHLYARKVGPNGAAYVSGVIKVGRDIDEKEIVGLGVRVGTKAGAIWTVQIPEAQVEAFTRLRGIEYIQIDEPLVPNLDSARRTTRVDSVHAGYNLPMQYSGAGVVVGVVDAGFDYRHPTLLDTSGTHYRVKRVWEQKNGAGTPPTGYIYGTEMVDSATIVAKGTDSAGTHGTHVAGICGGSGFGSTDNALYRGVAYGADLVFVGITPDKTQWVNTGVSDMIDGINYVFRYAESVGKPAVVNLSWGSPLGPRDGSGLFSQALDNLVGEGKIFVCSAGNNGDNRIHLHKDFTPTDTLLQTFLTIPETPGGKLTWVDMWGDTGVTFCVSVSLYHNGAISTTTGFLCIDDSTHDAHLVGSNGDTCFISISTSFSEFNNKPRVFLDFDSRVTDSIVIGVKGNNGPVNIWDSYVYKTSGYYGSFNSFNKGWTTSGNSDISISDVASSREAITVGAYASKVNWTDLSGVGHSYSSYVGRGRLVPFSSRGPTADGRIKPDITAPGLTLASAISSFDTAFAPGGSETLFLTSTYHNPLDGRDYSYGVLSGTSMSSPMVSGIVGLLLQASPELTPQEVKEIIWSTSIQDASTGTLPADGNNNWGRGKINAYGAMQRTLQLAEATERLAVKATASSVAPNPGTGVFTLHYKSAKATDVQVEIRTLSGVSVRSERWRVNTGENTRQYDLAGITSGVYLVDVVAQGTHDVVKVIVE